VCAFRRPLRRSYWALFGVVLAMLATAAAPARNVEVLQVGTTGGVISSADGRIHCGSRCTASYPRGALVVLRVSDSPYFGFDHWSAGCVGLAMSCVVVMDSAASVRAVFYSI